MFGLCSEKKYLQLKQEYESKMKEVDKLTSDIVKRIHELGIQNSDIAKSVQELNDKVNTVCSYLDKNGRKKTVDGVPVSDFALFINGQEDVKSSPAESKKTKTKTTKSTRAKTKTKAKEDKAE